jgi:hypothetical protein
MGTLTRWAVLFLLFASVIVPTSAADAPAKKEGDSPKKKEQKHEEEYVVVGQYEGVITNFTSGQKTFTATVSVRVPDEAALRHMADLKQQLAGTRDGNAAAKLLREINQGAETKVDRTFEASEDVKVRTSDLPVEFDENGKRKKYNSAELKQKKGGNLWGYPSDIEQLAKGTNVKLFLSVKKSTAEAMKKRKKTTRPARPKTDAADPTEDDPPLVRMIYILGETKKPG